MKLSLILEAKLNRPWLEKQLGKDNPSVDKIVASDPTNGSYYAWLCKLVQSTGSDEFLTPALRNDLDEWDRNKQILKNLNINADLTGKDLQYFNANLEKLREHKALKASSKRGSGVTYMSKEYPGAKVILDDGTYKLFKIEGTSPEAIDSLERLGVGTEWCTRKRGIAGQARYYLSRATQYVLYKDKKPLYQFGGDDFKDVKDENTAPTKDEAMMLLKIVKDRRPILTTLVRRASKEKRRDLESEPYIVKDPWSAYAYARDVMQGERWLEAEPYILKDSSVAYSYARDVIKDRWPEAEPYILKDPELAVRYARDVIKDRWPKLEPYIEKNPELATWYARHVMKWERWLEAESYILKDLNVAIQYASQVIKNRWPELESYIIKEPEVAYRYAYYVMKGERWPDAEQYIMQDPKAAVLYARFVIKGPWPAAEPYILKNPTWASSYALMKGKRWPELEPHIIQDPERAYWYAYHILKRRWPEAEPYISRSPKWSRAYAARFKDYVIDRQNIARSTGRVGIPGQKNWALYSESI